MLQFGVEKECFSNLVLFFYNDEHFNIERERVKRTELNSHFHKWTALEWDNPLISQCAGFYLVTRHFRASDPSCLMKTKQLEPNRSQRARPQGVHMKMHVTSQRITTTKKSHNWMDKSNIHFIRIILLKGTSIGI